MLAFVDTCEIKCERWVPLIFTNFISSIGKSELIQKRLREVFNKAVAMAIQAGREAEELGRLEARDSLGLAEPEPAETISLLSQDAMDTVMQEPGANQGTTHLETTGDAEDD